MHTLQKQIQSTPKAAIMYNPCIILSLFFALILFSALPLTEAAGGRWRMLQKSVGIAAMHMQLLRNDRVVMFDRTDFGPSNLSLPGGKCLRDPKAVVKVDCTAHSIEYNVVANTFRPLMVQSDVWCSSGSVFTDGTLVQTGGFNSGERRVRTFEPCSTCDWKEIQLGLLARRWYATNHILPDGRQIIIGGRRQFNYEFYPKTAATQKLFDLPFLAETNDNNIENNLYPFVFLQPDGNLFIFANNRAILFDYTKNRVVRTFPAIPDGEPRCYPSTGSAVMLPLKLDAKSIEVEVLVCGGAPKGSYTKANRGVFVEALKTCARIKITDRNPKWVMETMPQPRVMVDMLLLPNGNVLLINGGSAGTAGWELGRKPVLNPVLYHTNNPLGRRFELQNPTTIPRMYHSTAILLRDGRVLVGGSNPNSLYNFTGVLFPTELSLEAFSPSYLDPEFSSFRPAIQYPISPAKVRHGQALKVGFTVPGRVAPTKVSVTILSPAFNTHSFSMNQRLLNLGSRAFRLRGSSKYEVEVTIPGSLIVAPSGYYMLYVVHQEIPSEGIWVQIA
ncbi:aldehyde oxidase GLOX-like [Cucurbita maxima]|uniref:Aldehyde oxidase GLOX n=1 Tax=Cucurbita maxima TaxID=3661 RepID=A0A6J1IXW4_CUCMA|nr:aldehyde oxidase GLOX-like [Cucurbita maxima]